MAEVFRELFWENRKPTDGLQQLHYEKIGNLVGQATSRKRSSFGFGCMRHGSVEAPTLWLNLAEHSSWKVETGWKKKRMSLHIGISRGVIKDAVFSRWTSIGFLSHSPKRVEHMKKDPIEEAAILAQASSFFLVTHVLNGTVRSMVAADLKKAPSFEAVRLASQEPVQQRLLPRLRCGDQLFKDFRQDRVEQLLVELRAADGG